MIPRTPVFQGDPWVMGRHRIMDDDSTDDATPVDSAKAIGDLAKAAIAHHTDSVRQWLAAPVNERAYFTDRIKTAWHDLHAYGIATQSTAAAAASGLMRAQRKLRGKK